MVTKRTTKHDEHNVVNFVQPLCALWPQPLVFQTL